MLMIDHILQLASHNPHLEREREAEGGGGGGGGGVKRVVDSSSSEGKLIRRQQKERPVGADDNSPFS